MNGLVVQCGGPTAVVNTTLASLVRTWQRSVKGTLFGGRYGLAALRGGDWLELSAADAAWLTRIEHSAGMALGGGRDRLAEDDLDAAVERLAGRRVDRVFLIGGNGTMAAARLLAARAASAARTLSVIGVPKTIDNDIPCTDVSPGFPSAARFAVEAVRDVAADATSMRGYEDVVLIEIMGRHAGWLAAATLLARSPGSGAPHIVLVPEQPIDDDRFCESVRRAHRDAGVCVVAVAEGVRDGVGRFLAERAATRDMERDEAGQLILGRSGGPLPYLAALVRTGLRLRCREVRPDVLQRSSQAHVSRLDRTLAELVGRAAVEAPAGGRIDGPQMIALRRAEGTWGTLPVPLDQVRGERAVPASVLSNPVVLSSLLS
jgi:6-phosphofructokinase 1